MAVVLSRSGSESRAAEEAAVAVGGEWRKWQWQQAVIRGGGGGSEWRRQRQ